MTIGANSYKSALQEMVDAHIELISIEGARYVPADAPLDEDYNRTLAQAERRMKRAVERACELLDAAYEKLK